jgi:hypothetical protein
MSQSSQHRILLALSLFSFATSAGAAPPTTGLQNEVKIKAPTRLDWQFTASGFGKDALKLPTNYDSQKQRYQLYVPEKYDPSRVWPLVVFVSPGDDPLGWRAWQKTCEAEGVFFCAAYAAGNNCPAGQRIRIVLDMFDDVRREYRIDPDRTCFSGFSGGARIACTLGGHLPEYCGGVVAISGTNPLPRLDYLRHRVQDRLSFAFITGSRDFNLRELRDYAFPLFNEVGVRSKLWNIRDLGHALPASEVLGEAFKWIEEDLPRRQADSKDRPLLGVPPEESMTPAKLAARQLDAAKAELREAERTWRGVVLLQGILSRWDNTEAGRQARKLLNEIQDDARRLKLAGEQGGAEERRILEAQAAAFERFGEVRAALQTWELLARQHPDTPEGRKADAAVQRLGRALAALPYLGLSLRGATAVIDKVVTDGPADRAGLRAGDRLMQVDASKITSASDLQALVAKHKPGDKIELHVERQGKKLMLTAELSATPREEK